MNPAIKSEIKNKFMKMKITITVLILIILSLSGFIIWQLYANKISVVYNNGYNVGSASVGIALYDLIEKKQCQPIELSMTVPDTATTTKEVNYNLINISI